MSTPSLDDKVVENYRRAGKIAKEALDCACSSAKEGAALIEVAEKTERLISSRGAACAFPINIGINQVAAHYTPRKGDPLKFSKGDLVKMDVGVHVDGCIADTAKTVEISTSNWKELIRASEDALAHSLEMLAPGVEVGSLGATIERAIKSRGFNPVKNLTGHSLEPYNLHAGITVPNVTSSDKSSLKSGTAIAIEPFATDGKGEVDGSKGGNIYLAIADKKLSDPSANDLRESIVKSFHHLPFASRWCAPLSKDYEALLRANWRHGNLRSYAILSEVSDGTVSQAEHSALILGGEVLIYTR